MSKRIRVEDDTLRLSIETHRKHIDRLEEAFRKIDKVCVKPKLNSEQKLAAIITIVNRALNPK